MSLGGSFESIDQYHLLFGHSQLAQCCCWRRDKYILCESLINDRGCFGSLDPSRRAHYTLDGCDNRTFGSGLHGELHRLLSHMVRSSTYTDRSEDSTEYSEEGRHGPHNLAPRGCRWRVRVESLLAIRPSLIQDHIRLRLRLLSICPSRCSTR